MQICHKSVKTVTGTLCSGTVVPYRRNTQFMRKEHRQDNPDGDNEGITRIS